MEFQILHFQYVTSTQDMAKQILKENVVILADAQKNGRGRLNHRWLSPPGGLWLTAIMKAGAKPQILSLMAGVSVAKALKNLCIEACLKWPNDIIFKGKKLGGIIGELQGNYALIGIGINLQNEIPDEIRDIATNLPDVQRDVLLMKILEFLGKDKNKDAEEIIREWKEHQCILGKKVRVVEEEEYIGIAEDIDEEGFLLVKVNGSQRRVVAGDVFLLE